MIPTAGLNKIRDWLAGTSTTKPLYIALGDGTDAEALTDTQLQNELDRKSVTVTRTIRNVTYESLWDDTELNGEEITELGLLSAVSTGTLFIRSVFSPISKNAAILLQVDVTIMVN